MSTYPWGIWLSAGDYTTSSDVLALNDGVNITCELGSLAAPPGTKSQDRTIKATLYFWGADQDGAVTLIRSVRRKLYQARFGTGASPMGLPVMLAIQLGTGGIVQFPVRAGTLDESGKGLSNFAAAVATGALSLTCGVLATSSRLTYLSPTSPITPGLGSAVSVPAVDGDEQALGHVILNDVSLSNGATPTVIQRVHLFGRAYDMLTTADFPGVYDTSAVSPGTTFSDSTASGGSCARLDPATKSFQPLASVSITDLPYAGGLLGWRLRVRDSTLGPSTPSLSVSPSVEPSIVQTTIQTVSYSTAPSPVWRQPTKAGSALYAIMIISATPSSVTAPSPWSFIAGSQILYSGEVKLSCYEIVNAASRSGTETGFSITGASFGAVTMVLMEIANVDQISPRVTMSLIYDGATSSTATTTAVTPTADWQYAVAIMASADPSATAPSSGPTNGYTEQASGTGSGSASYMATVVADFVPGTSLSATNTSETFTVAGVTWAIEILFQAGALDEIDAYTLSVTALDAAGNESAPATTYLSPTTYPNADVTITPGAGGSTVDYYRYYYWRSGISTAYVDLASGQTAFTFADENGTLGNAPTSDVTAHAQFRLSVGLPSGQTLYQGDPVSCQVSNGLWEDINMGVFAGGAAPQDASLPPGCYALVEGLHPTNDSAILDVDIAYTTSVREPQWQAPPDNTAPLALATPHVWVFDANRWEGLQSCVLYGRPIALTNPSSLVTLNDDSTVTITAAGAMIEVPSSLLTAAQGWFAAYLVPAWTSTSPPANAPVLFQWGSGANEVGVSFSGGYWNLYSVAASTNTSASQAASFAASTGHVVIATWSATTLGVGMDTTTLATHAAGSAPSSLPSTIAIGNVSAGSYPLDGNVGWVAMGTGVLSGVDLAYLVAIGATDPCLLELSSGAAPTFAWYATRLDYGLDAQEHGTAELTGPPLLQPKDNVLVCRVDSNDLASDVVHERYTLHVQATPRYTFLSEVVG